MKKLLILGDTGLLGSMVVSYFMGIDGYDLTGTYNRKSFSELTGKNIKELRYNPIEGGQSIAGLLEEIRPDYIINCIGVIKPYCNSGISEEVYRAVYINSMFPHQLSAAALKTDKKIRIIQIATDCVYDGASGGYRESDVHNPIDVYGKTKSLGEVMASNFLNIRCSIIGPELQNRISLLEWFLSAASGSVRDGYINHFWNGVSTLQFAELCHKLTCDDNWDTFRRKNHTLHYIKNKSLSKYELLGIFNEIFDSKLTVRSFESPEKTDRTLASDYLFEDLLEMKTAIHEFKTFIDTNNYYGDTDKR